MPHIYIYICILYIPDDVTMTLDGILQDLRNMDIHSTRNSWTMRFVLLKVGDLVFEKKWSCGFPKLCGCSGDEAHVAPSLTIAMVQHLKV